MFTCAGFATTRDRPVIPVPKGASTGCYKPVNDYLDGLHKNYLPFISFILTLFAVQMFLGLVIVIFRIFR